MTTGATLVANVQRQVLSGLREQANKLNGSLDNSQTTVTLLYSLLNGANAIAEGSVLSVDVERMYVWSVNTTSSTAVVERGWDGTTAATHADASLVGINSRCDKFSALSAVNDDLDALSSPGNGLFQIKSVEVPFNIATVGYDLTGVTSLDDVYAVEARYSWLNHNWQPVRSYRTERAQNLTDFPSGFALWLFEGGQPGQNVRVLYKAPFARLSALTDDVQSVSGLPATANDIPVLGAIELLWTPRELKRNFTESQSEPRRAEEVPPGAVSNSVNGIMRRRQRRIEEERLRLQRQYPVRSRSV